MPSTKFSRIGLMLALAALLALTRVNHFGALPDASWAVFMAAGFYFRAQWRWLFPSLMALAVAVDWWVISASGQDFFAHYCVSPGYWFLLPAHFSMWAAGAALCSLQARGVAWQLLALPLITVVAVVVCHAFAQGGFYWLSASVAEPSLAGWWKNYTDWLLPYMSTVAIYVGVFALLHGVVEAARWASRKAGADTLKH